MLIPFLLIPCAAAWRLAKFNLDTSQAFSFKGLPSPAAGLTIASLPLIIFYQQFGLDILLTGKWILYSIILLVSFLMISNVTLLSLKFKNFNVITNLPKYFLVTISLFAIIFLKWVAVPAILISYILVSLIFKNKTA